MVPARLCQPLEIQHLTQRHAPQREDKLVQVELLMGGPGLERRAVAGHGGEVAVVQPVEDALLLRQACKTVLAAVFAKGETATLGRGLQGILLNPAGAKAKVDVNRSNLVSLWVDGQYVPDEEDVANMDIAALRVWADVDALMLTAQRKLLVADRVVVEGFVLDALRFGIRAVVEEDAAAGDAMI